MKTRTMTWISVLAALNLAAGSASADSDGQATFGSQWWNQSSAEAKYREYRDLPRGGFLETFLLRQWQDGWSAAMWGRDALQKDQDIGLSLSRGVRWRVDGRFQSIPHLFSQVARSPYAEVKPGTFRLADSLQRVNQEYPGALISNMNSWLASAPVTGLGTESSVSSVRLRSRPGKGWKLELRGSERQREGHQAYGATFGVSNEIELPVPVSQRTRDGDAIASYEQGRVRVQATAGVSDFTDNVSTLVWDNPRRYTDGPTNATGSSQGRMALAPDNQVVRGQLGLDLKLPRASILAANFSASAGRQNDPFIPYTINTALAWSNPDSLPARSLNAKAVTVAQDYRLSGSPFTNVWAALRYHGEQYTNKTDQLTFNGFSPVDYTWAADTTEQDLLSWSRSTLGADLDVDPVSWLGASVVVEHQHRSHNDREVLADHENVLGGSLRLRPIEGLDLSGTVRHGVRRQDNFDVSVYDGADPKGLRRFDVANRDQDLAQGQAGYGLGERIDLAVSYAYTRNNYPDTQFGLLSTKDQMPMVDATYHLSSQFDLGGGWGGDIADSRQHGYDSNSKDWFAQLHDRTSFVYLRGTWWPIANKLSVVGDYDYTWDMVEYRLTGRDKFAAGDTTAGNTAGTVAQDLPNTFYRLQQLGFEGRWHGKGNLDVAVRYAYELYDITDFSVMGLPLLGLTTARTGTTFTTTAASLFLGDNLQPYHAHRLGVVVTRRF